MKPITHQATNLLHHRIGDLENLLQCPNGRTSLHHRIGDLEKQVTGISINAFLHHRIGDLES